jgi:hypothetical protein
MLRAMSLPMSNAAGAGIKNIVLLSLWRKKHFYA